MRKNIIKCSQCDMEFPGGYEYRMHWEQVHFYPYLNKDGFDHKQALEDARSNRHVDRLISEISDNI